jgi:hypothetical protein
MQKPSQSWQAKQPQVQGWPSSSKKGWAYLEELFNVTHQSLVGDKDHDVIIPLNNGIVMGHQDLGSIIFATHNSSKSRTLGQADFFDAPAN